MMQEMVEKKLKDKVGIQDTYVLYKKVSGNPIERGKYLKIVNGLFKYMISLVLSGEHIELPLGMGSMYIRGLKIKPKIDEHGNIKGYISPNWAKTKLLRDSCPECAAKRQLVYNLNEHTNGVNYQFRWVKKDISVENISFYSFILTRTNKRTLSNLIKDGKEYFVETRRS